MCHAQVNLNGLNRAELTLPLRRNYLRGARILQQLTIAQLVKFFSVHNTLQLDNVLTHMNPVHARITRFFTSDLNIILPFKT